MSIQSPQQPPLYSAANTYYNAIPAISAATSALYTPGNRVDKATAGVGGFAHGLIYQQVNNAYQRWLQHLYKTHPKLAEEMNEHPILVGVPMAIPGIIIGYKLGNIGQDNVIDLLLRPNIRQKMENLLYRTKQGNFAADTLRPVGQFLNKPMARLAVFGASLVFAAALLVQLLVDGNRRGKEYQQARKDIPYKEATPYELKAAIAQQRSMAMNG